MRKRIISTGVVISLSLTTCLSITQSALATTAKAKEHKINRIKPKTTYSDGLLSIYFKEYNANLPSDITITAEPIINAGKQGKVLGIIGYPDFKKNAIKASQTAKKRAEAIRHFLEDNGVPFSNMQLMRPVETYHGQIITPDGNRFDVMILDDKNEKLVLTTTAINQPKAIYADGTLRVYFADETTEFPSNLLAEASPLIQAIKQKNVQDKALGISAYTPSTGDVAKNSRLIKNRAVAVRQFLEANGVPETQIKFVKPATRMTKKSELLNDNPVEVFIFEE